MLPNSEKIGEELLKMKASGTLPSREEMLEQFQVGGHLPMLLDYFHKVAELFEHMSVQSKRWNHLEKHPFECVIFSHLVRFKRYTIGLTRLSFFHGQGMVHCIDCYYPILKSIFELCVENRLVAAYVHDFGRTLESKEQVARRILTYADYSKKKHNQKFPYLPNFYDTPDNLKPQSIRDFEQKTTSEINRDIGKVAKQLNGRRGKGKPQHWYPTEDARQQKIGEERYFGSMQWRCRDVLGGYVGEVKEREFWRTAYDTIYDLLNRYSHPVLGYDDNLRPEPDRLFDLYHVMGGFISILDQFIIPGLIRDLEIHIEESPEMLQIFNKMEVLKKEVCLDLSVLSLALNLRTD
ncbi:hypothetical protein Pcar_2920 [Syntrophotalea carbinolica DSM 2380]|uniref:Uncharacterized protein n=1 Tax=Syntrophotalea carbinolica (strain DSM 2380 / NBRC 103641 / GraBd1) TaxID=338963 RepID=Q3A0F2_SYNC1|nr:hypothetical protein [Syntrophotalea carbinolica]ABA90155.1 hypothetical protein Pcar_2920 [Syntrophotalea carbinolica DSM 2380]